MSTLSTVGNSLGERLATIMGSNVVVLWSPSTPPASSTKTAAAPGSDAPGLTARTTAALWDGAEPPAFGSRASIERRYGEE